MAETLNILGHERCRFLSNKEMFYEVEPDLSGPHRGSGLFWCSKTQTCLGPDGQMVDERECQPGRSCYDRV